MKTTIALRRVVPAALAVLAAAGCARHDAATPRADGGPPVEVAVLRAGTAGAGALLLPGRVTARDEVTLAARLAARLTALPLGEGARFRAGQVLARFDAPETRAALEGARAGLAAATLGRDLARRQEGRMDSLHAARVAALRELEGAQAERRAAEAAWAQARSQVDAMESGVALTAPFDGVVVRRHVDPGTTVGPGQPLLDVRSEAVGAIACPVPESELPRLSGGPAEAQVGDGPWLPVRLARLDCMTDPATRTRVARFEPAPGTRLEPGAFARVRLPGALATAAPPLRLVPASALVRRGGLAGVFVIEAGAARLRWLRLGREGGGTVEVLAGLEPGDAVIAFPAGLADGRAVRVRP